MSDQSRKCYGCDHFFESYFCGYISCNCKIYGSLDVDQHERHPDFTAAHCKDYTPKRPKRPETEEERLQRLIRVLWPDGYR